MVNPIFVLFYLLVIPIICLSNGGINEEKSKIITLQLDGGFLNKIIFQHPSKINVATFTPLKQEWDYLLQKAAQGINQSEFEHSFLEIYRKALEAGYRDEIFINAHQKYLEILIEKELKVPGEVKEFQGLKSTYLNEILHNIINGKLDNLSEETKNLVNRLKNNDTAGINGDENIKKKLNGIHKKKPYKSKRSSINLSSLSASFIGTFFLIIIYKPLIYLFGLLPVKNK
ncbi:MAG: hypothetical protein WDZ41_03220 [Candidatus Babeliales bacterium]